VRLASYDPRATVNLNCSEADYQALAREDLSSPAGKMSSLPIATIEAGKQLPLVNAINPSWFKALQKFRESVIMPVFGDIKSLSIEQWESILGYFDHYKNWLASKPVTVVEKLDISRLREIAASNAHKTIVQLIDEDLALEKEVNGVIAVDRITHYVRDLHVLLNNFVTFRDFYDRTKKAVFQIGTLYLDGRSCDLCIRVDDPGKHAELATLSRVYLTYCTCIKKGSTEKMTIAAAFTDGDSDQLRVGRNGIFYDRKGQDWDATIVKIIEHPISLRQAFWSPYKQFGRMISDQIQKIAAARSKSVEEKAASTVTETSTKIVDTGKAPTAQPFDVAKFAGIFAAIGLAIGAIGTAFASIITGFMTLKWWQIPVALAGIMLLISGPSMVLAWFKLRERNLGPILDANGWAINARVKINIPFGNSLTSIATLPKGSSRTYVDPYAEKKQPWALYIFLILVIILIGWLIHEKTIVAALLAKLGL
jgi:hypothetical protein